MEVNIGAVYRCCLDTLERADKAGKLDNAKDGMRIKCFNCGDSLRLRDGVWEWAGKDKEHKGL